MMPLRFRIPVFFLAVAASAASAQQIPGTELTQALASRPALESLLVRLEEAGQSRDYSAVLREQAARQAAQVRARLTDGDFRVGDRVALIVSGESSLVDTFTVQSGREILLPNVGVIPLQGVLRYELTNYLTDRLSRFIRDPQVRARSLIKVTIIGGVTTPGFHTVPVDIPIDAVLAAAGGVTASADLDRITVERGSEVILDGGTVQEVITQGLTLDALGIRAGDRFRVPAMPQQTQSMVQRAQGWTYLLALPFSLLALGRLFGF